MKTRLEVLERLMGHMKKNYDDFWEIKAEAIEYNIFDDLQSAAAILG